MNSVEKPIQQISQQIDLLTVLIIIAAYVLVMIVIGFVTSKYNKNSSEYFLGGRTIGPWLASISSTASSESGWLVLGAVGLVYMEGISAWWFLPGCLFGYVINWTFLAKRMRQFSKERSSITLPDYIADIIGDRNHGLRSIAVTIIFLSLMVYVAAQFSASGKDLGAVFGLQIEEQWPVMIAGAGIIILYTLVGGFRAVVWTDYIQGLMMVIALVGMPFVALFSIADWSTIVSTITTEVPHFFVFTGKEAGFAVIGSIIGFLGIGLGYPGQPHVINRYMSARNDKAIAQGRIIAFSWGLLAYGGAIGLGIVGHALIPGLNKEESEMLLPLLSIQLLHPILAGVIIASVLAAIMSTASAQLLVASSALSHDVLGKISKKSLSQKQMVRFARLFVMLLGLLALVFALLYREVVFWMVLFAWSSLGAAFGPLVLLSLTKIKISFAGAAAGMIIGFLTTLIWKLSGLSNYIYELVPAFGLAILAIILGSKLKPNQSTSKLTN
jgi:sodium/proline symporter